MKKLWQNLSSLVGGGWVKLTNGQGNPTPVIVTECAQPDKLQAKMQEKHLTHGQTVVADLHNVRLMKQEKTRDLELRFCDMEEIKIHKQITPGDGGDLPRYVLNPKGLTVATRKQGYYILRNVILTSNGTMQIEATQETKWQLVTAG